MQEIERTFLLSSIPDDLETYSAKQMVDLYIPANSPHPQLRLRKNGDNHMITRKYPKISGDNSVMIEETIDLSADEYEALKNADGKLLQKTRYLKQFDGYTCELDIFEADLTGHAVVDFEFDSEDLAKQFIPPYFCGLEITHIEGLAGGKIVGKTYADIRKLIDMHSS